MRKQLRHYEALGYLKHYGMPYTFVFAPSNGMGGESSLERPSWNGRNVAVTAQTPGSDLIHELGHWLVSAPERRLFPNFGLGDDFRSSAYPRKRVKDPQPEEQAVCVFEIGFFWKLGFNWKHIANGVNFWIHTSWEKYTETDEVTKTSIEVLNQLGLFDGLGPKDLPTLGKLRWDIARAKKEVEEWKVQYWG